MVRFQLLPDDSFDIFLFHNASLWYQFVFVDFYTIIEALYVLSNCIDLFILHFLQHPLDVGITKNLGDFLPNGPVFEGQFGLTPSKMRKAFMILDCTLFIESLQETVTQFAYVTKQGAYQNSFNIENVTYGMIPPATLEQQIELSEFAEEFTLCFISNCIFLEDVTKADQLVIILEKENQGFKFREELLDSLQGKRAAMDYNTSLAELLAVHKDALEKQSNLPPTQIFELVFKAVQLAGKTNILPVITKHAFHWLDKKWSFIDEKQRFLLKHPAFYEDSINQARIAKRDSWTEKLINLMQAILPTMGIRNESQLSRILNDLLKANR
ncbi:MAG: hypothetical protein SD837_21030 [Candidatus Electrothrix scaldis]|nr:MAG: hypothetical protein SD837_21030 [Candidatus Electrothrix sp. GW3-3]